MSDDIHKPLVCAALAHLHENGETSKEFLVAAVPGLNGFRLDMMRRNGLVLLIASGDWRSYTITNGGRRYAGIAIDKTGVAGSRNLVGSGTYDGKELKPFDGRPGCNAAFGLPSLGFGA